MEIIRLTAPEQHEVTPATVELDAKAVKNWINELPLNNAIVTVKQLQGAIHALNAVNLPTAKRLKLMEIYHGILQRLLHYYDELRLQQLPLSGAERLLLIQEIVWLFQSLSQGYNIVVKAVYGNDNHKESTYHILRAAFCSLQALSYSYLFAVKFDVKIPPLVFLEAHQLYRFAERYYVNDLKVKGIKGNSQTPTIGGLYRQFLLTSLAVSEGYEARRVLELYDALDQFANKSHVTDELNKDIHCVNFVIDLFEDRPPHLLHGGMGAPAGQDHRYLDIEPTLSFILAWVDSFAHTKMAEDFKREIHLLEYFSSLIYSVVNENTPEILENCRFKVLTQTTKAQRPVVRKGQKPISALEYYEQGRNQKSPGGIVAHPPGAEQKCSLVRTKDAVKVVTGLSLVIGDIEAGEVVSVSQSPDDNGQASQLIAIISAKRVNEIEVELDLVVLSVRAVPVTYVSEDVVSIGNKKHVGLYFPADQKYNPHASMLIDKRDFSVNGRFQVLLNNQTFLVKAKETLKDTERFVQFRFSAVKQASIQRAG